MLTIGIHIGHFTIRISQSYTKPGDSHIQFGTVEWPSHTHTHWYSCYGGALPNAYDPTSGKVGYEALDEVGLASVARLDSDFFQKLLGEGSEYEEVSRIWERVQQSFRNCPALRVREPVHVGLILDGIELSPSANKWRPWSRPADRTPVLVERLQVLGKKAGLQQYDVLSDRAAMERYVSSQEVMQQGEVIAIVESDYTRLWEVTDPTRGLLRPLCSTTGIRHLLTRIERTEASKEDTLRLLLEELQEPGRRTAQCQGVSQWQEERLFPEILRAVRQLPSTKAKRKRVLHFGGEGAALLSAIAVPTDRAQVADWQASGLYMLADGAAAVVCDARMKNAEA